MLSPEAKAALMARLSGTTQEVEAPVEEVAGIPEPTQVPEVVVEATPVSPEPVVETQPKMVPLDDLVKVRQARNTAREELAKQRETNARLEGELNALRQAAKPTDWISEALTPEPDEPDPVADLRATVEEIQAERRAGLLSKVIDLVREAEPTLSEKRLVDELAKGKTPQQVVTEWQELRQEILKTAPAPTVVSIPSPATTKAPPPTVNRATATPGVLKPTSWNDVSKAVRQAVTK
jgi:hypothetical protein